MNEQREGGVEMEMLVYDYDSLQSGVGGVWSSEGWSGDCLLKW